MTLLILQKPTDKNLRLFSENEQFGKSRLIRQLYLEIKLSTWPSA